MGGEVAVTGVPRAHRTPGPHLRQETRPMDKTDSQAARELALDVYGGDPAKLERTYEAYQMFSRSAASAISYRNSTANILARADSADESLRNCFLRYGEAGARSQSDT